MATLFDNADVIDQLLNTSGKGDKLLGTWGDVPRLLQHLDAADLTPKHRVTLRAAFKLQCVAEARAQIRAPADTFALLRDLAAEPQEHFVVLCLSTRNHVVRRQTVYVGSLNTSVVRLGEVLRPALVHNAAAIIVAHNHPSGDPSPSPEDVAVTRNLIEAGKLLDIDVLDHIVVGADRFVSLRERGLAFT